MKQLALLALVGCGGGGTGDMPVDAAAAIDGRAIDATLGIDAPASGIVHVSVVLQQSPFPGADIVFSAADGTVTSHVTTAADGTASATVAPGSSVTAVLTVGAASLVETVLGIEPGDTIPMGLPGTPMPAATPIGTAKFVFPGPVAGANVYVGDVGCNSVGGPDTTTRSTTMDTSCLTVGGTYDAMITASDPAGNPLAYATLTDLVPPGAGNTATLGFGAWRTDFATHDATIVHATPGAMVSSSLELHHDGVRYSPYHDVSATANSGGGATVSLVFPKSFGAEIVYNIGVAGTAGLGGQVLHTLDGRGPPTQPAETLDLANDFPATFTTRAVDVATGKSTPRMTWAVLPGGAPAVAGIAHVAWADGGNTVDWVVVMPPGTPSPVQFPDVPDALAAVRAQPTTTFTTAEIGMHVGTLFASYAAVRAAWFDLLLSQVTRDHVELISAIN